MKKGKKHPVLQELNVDGNTTSSVSSSDILNFLLSKNVVPEEAVRSAIQSLSETKKATNTPLLSSPNHKEVKEEGNKPRTRHIALRFYYDGANYSGLAQNVGQESDNSVERTLFQALLRARLVESRESCGYSRCGRTDRGVSAVGQVVALRLKSAVPKYASVDSDGTSLISNQDLPKNEYTKIKTWVYPKKKKKVDTSANRVEKEMGEYHYAKILNNLLPPEIRILGWAPVSEEFSARFSANARTYRYFFVKRQMDLEMIRQGLARMVGKHDFRNFCKMDVEKVYNFERLIYDANVVELPRGDVCYLKIHGQAFLWHQIRCIAEILFMIGRGLEKPEIVTELLDVKKYPGKPAYQLAADKPLVLHDCGFPNLTFGYSVQNLWTVSCQLEQQWEDLTLAATRIRNCIDSFRELYVLKEDLVHFATNKVNERQKKAQRLNPFASLEDSTIDLDDMGEKDSSTITWEQALSCLWNLDLFAEPHALNNHFHIPLLNRSKGTTYEQKLEALKKSDKKRKKYEEGYLKKRKTTEEDMKFYEHMAKQGGTGL